MIDSCLDLGIATFDHADIYGDYTCESLFGETLKTDSHLRDRMQLVSKCGIKLVSPNRSKHTLKRYDTSQRHIFKSVENSLRNLHTDRLDLLLILGTGNLDRIRSAVGAEAFHLTREQWFAIWSASTGLLVS